MNLFKVELNGEPFYFADRASAKLHRDFANREKRYNVVVSRGPDHWRGESFNRNLNPTPSSKGPAW